MAIGRLGRDEGVFTIYRTLEGRFCHGWSKDESAV